MTKRLVGGVVVAFLLFGWLGVGSVSSDVPVNCDRFWYTLECLLR